MKTHIFKIAFLLFCFTSMTAPLSAQIKKEPTKKETTTPKQVRIELTDGSSVEGKLMERRGDTVIVESAALGLVNLNIKNIKNIDALTTENTKSSTYWFENIHAPHNYFAPTAYNFRKGEGYYGNIFLFFHQIGYGFTNHFSVSGGTELISFFFNGGSVRGPQFFYLNPKFSYDLDKNLTLGAGSFFFFIREGGDLQSVPIPYGIVTLGNRNNNISIGAGAPIIDGTKLLFTLSGQARLTRGISLMSENYITRDGDVVGIGTTGFRFMSKSLAFNVGFMYGLNSGGVDDIFGTGSSIPFPFLGFSIPFREKKELILS